MAAAGVDLAAVVSPSEASRRRARAALPGVTVLDPATALPASGGILVAVPDRAVAACAETLAASPPDGLARALHTSGLLPASALAPLAGTGASLGSLHPLVSFPSADGALVPLAGAFAAVEGEDAAAATATALAWRLGMEPHRIDAGAKPRYHAAAAVAANLAHTVVLGAREELVGAGLEPDVAAAALAPLVLGAVQSALDGVPWRHLTGAVARGDAATVSAHLGALDPDLAAVYRSAARFAVTRLTAEGLLENTLADELKAALTDPR